MTINQKNLDEILERQLKNISEDMKLSNSDIKRILKYTTTSIFDKNECCIWQGSIIKNNGLYINFFFNNKKIALHRLLYINFINNLEKNTYLSYSCINPGICCNINHIKIKKNIKKNISNNNNIVYFD